MAALEHTAVISFRKLITLWTKTLASHEIIDNGGKLALNVTNSGSTGFVCEITLFEGVTFVRVVVVKFNTPAGQSLTVTRSRKYFPFSETSLMLFAHNVTLITPAESFPVTFFLLTIFDECFNNAETTSLSSTVKCR